MTTTTKIEKHDLYPFVGIIHDDGTHHRISRWSSGYDLDDNGYVYPERGRYALRLATGDRWYALIQKMGYEPKWLVLREKLDNVRKIEALRWRALLIAQRRLATFIDVEDQARALGRIWCKGYRAEFNFLIWGGRREGLHRKTPNELLDGRTSVVDRLAIIPTPEEEETVGAEYDETQKSLMCSHRRVEMINEILATALLVNGIAPTYYEPLLGYRRTKRSRITINGRVYYQVEDERNGSQRVWPEPGDTLVDF